MIRRLTSLAACAALVAAGASAAVAQNVSSGSYLQSCTNVRTSGSTLIATCTNPQGIPVTSSVNLNACSGDIANVGGRLACSGGGSTMYGRSRRHHHHGNAYGHYKDNDDNGHGRGHDKDKDHH